MSLQIIEECFTHLTSAPPLYLTEHLIPQLNCTFCQQLHLLQTAHNRPIHYLSELMLLGMSSSRLTRQLLLILARNLQQKPLIKALMEGDWVSAKKEALAKGFYQFLPICQSLVPHHHLSRGYFQYPLPTWALTDQIQHKIFQGKGHIGNRYWEAARGAIHQNFCKTTNEQEVLALLLLSGHPSITSRLGQKIKFWSSLYIVDYKNTMYKFYQFKQRFSPVLEYQCPDLPQTLTPSISNDLPSQLKELEVLAKNPLQSLVHSLMSSVMAAEAGDSNSLERQIICARKVLESEGGGVRERFEQLVVCLKDVCGKLQR